MRGGFVMTGRAHRGWRGQGGHGGRGGWQQADLPPADDAASWLAGRPDARGKEHKAHAWSFYAGWSTDHGEGDFYSSLWRDDRAVASALEDLLRAQGAWRIVEALLHGAGPAAPVTAAPAPA